MVTVAMMLPAPPVGCILAVDSVTRVNSSRKLVYEVVVVVVDEVVETEV